MSFPELNVELSLSVKPTETPVWIDITDKVLSASVRRGRDNEFGPMQMGTCEVVLDNTDRRFDPTYAGVLVNRISNPSAETGLGWWATVDPAITAYSVWGGYFGSYSFRFPVPVITTIATDTFTDADATLLPAHVMDSGGLAWTVVSATWTINSNVVGISNTRGVATFPAGVGWADIQIHAHCSVGNGYYSGIVLRYTDATHYWYVDINGRLNVDGAARFQLWEYNGALTLRASSSAMAIADNTYYPITVTAVGQTITAVFDNDGTTISYSSAALNETVTTHGLTGRAANIDDMIVTSPPAWNDMVSPQITCGGGETWTASCYAMPGSTLVWARYSTTVTTSAGATWIKYWLYTYQDGRLSLRIDDSAGTLYEEILVATGGVNGYVDGCQLEQGTLSPYCDGTQDNCKWVGAAHNSNSIRGGPYYGTLLPMRRLRIRCPGEAGYYNIFSGYVDGWPQTWDDGVSAIITVRACDGFKVLQLAELNETFTEELSGSRVNNVLDSVRWTVGGTWLLGSTVDSQLGTTTILGPTGGRAISEGDSDVMAHAVANANALQYLNDVADSEYGMLYVDGSGSVVFRNRHYGYGTTSVATFGDGVGENGYSDFALDYDDQHIWNDVRLARIDGTAQNASDTDSQLTYFKRTMQNDRLLLTTDVAVAARANYLLLRYKDPHPRSRGFTLGGGEPMWIAMLVAEIGDRITVTRRPQGGTAITTQFRIEGIEHSIATQQPGQSWQTRFALSTADAMSYWMVTTGADEYATMAVLDFTTVLAY